MEAAEVLVQIGSVAILRVRECGGAYTSLSIPPWQISVCTKLRILPWRT